VANTAADLILYNARVITLDDNQPEAELVAIKDNKILGIGGNDSLWLFQGARTRLINCKGKTIIPGFNDAHCHPLSFAATLLYVDCSPVVTKNISEIQALIRQKAEKLPKGKWVRAAQYDEYYLTDKRPPNRWELDEASPNHPAILVHRSGNICVLNSLALSLLNIARDTPNPQGGYIGREKDTGEPDGLIAGRNEQVEKGVPPLDEEEIEQGVRLAVQEYLSYGITSLQDTSWTNDLHHWKTLRLFKERGILPLRVSMLAGSDALEEFKNSGLLMGCGNNQLRIGGVKIALDESTGCPHPPQEELNHHAFKAHKAGFQLALHVNDVHTLQTALASLDFVLRQIPRPDHRHRLEHCAVCPPGLLRRLKTTGAIVVTQPPFLYYHGENYIKTVSPDKFNWLYPLRSFHRQGIKVAASSDSPMVPCSPLAGIYAAVTRKVKTGQALAPQEGLSPLEALRMYTIQAAYVSFEETAKGTISPGKLADLVVLSADPTQVAPEEVKEIKVMLTIIDGKVEWERGV